MTLLTDRLGATALAVVVNGQAAPLGRIGQVTIRHGRQGADSQPDAATCQVTCYGDAVPALPAVGQPLTVHLGTSGLAALGLTGSDATAAAPRFIGTITDVEASPGAAGVAGAGILSITAVGPTARLGRVTVGDTPWPAETDGARAGRILALASSPAAITVGTVDPGTVDILGRDVDAQPALGLLEELAAEAGGVVATRRDGAVEYHDANHRRNATPLLTLSAANVLASATWRQQVSGLVNDLTVAYGAAEPQATVRVTDPQSITAYGPMAATLNSHLTDAAAATARANDAVGRLSRPRWRVDSLHVDALRTLTAAQAAALARAELGALITVTGFPSTGPFVTARLFIEGWAETWADEGWRVDLDVTEYGLTGPSPVWATLPTSLTWATVQAELSWLSAAGWYPGEPPGGRWVDLPSGDQWASNTRTWATV